MRAGLSTIQQTLTPEAASVLNLSIAEAGRRNHGQTTPLHVAATLLSAPSGFLRQACIRSHPNSSHPLQCRALELCFSVALERLPTAQNMAPGMEPPISNALMAALKRAQAHQRRGCPEQQQQPLLAVKVELEQLIISILDDPSVSRVMREASFSSPAVKATIEQSLNSTSHPHHHHHHHHHHHPGNVSLGTFGGIGPRMLTSPIASPSPTTTPSSAVPLPNRNMYVNPKLKQGVSGPLGNQRNEDVTKVLDILMRSKKRNPVLVGESEPEAVVKELFRRIEKGDFGLDGPLKNVQVISIDKELLCDKSQITAKIKELGSLMESRINDNGGGVILDLGDLKWLVEQPVNFGSSGGVPQQQQMVSETGKAAVVEMGKLLARFSESNSTSKFWLIGTATCETYLRCQIYHSSMESDWDLQAVPIASRSPMPGMFSRLGSSMDPLNPLKSFPSMVPAFPRRIPENVDPSRRTSCCPHCMEKYEEELKVLTKEFENHSSENKSEAAKPPLPMWLQNAKLHSGEANAMNPLQGKNSELRLKQKTQELQRKWNDRCLNLHPNFHKTVSLDRVAPTALPAMSLYNPKLLSHQPLQPKLPETCKFGETLSLNTNQNSAQTMQRASTPPGSPVRTELALGRKVSETCPEKTNETPENHVKDFLSSISAESQTKFLEKFANALDADTFKKLLKGLMEKAWWQSEAASAVASAVTKCRLGNGKRRGSGSKGDIWLLFTGPDRIGKRKMASVLSEQICGTNPVTISLGSRRDDAEPDTNTSIRGKTALDRIAEAVRRNPFSVIVLEDIDEADMLLRGNIRRAIDRGRLTDSHGREISLGNVIFILTGNWSSVGNAHLVDEKRLAATAGGNWQLKLITMEEKNAKRRACWLQDEGRSRKARKDANFDLNLAADTEDDRTDGSHNSSDLTIDHEEELGLETRQFSITSVPHELVSSVDDTIVFKPVDFGFVRREIKKTISAKFSTLVGDDDDEMRKRVSIQVEEDAVEKIIGGLWHGRSSLEEWVEKALTPKFEEIKSRLPSSGEKTTVVQLRLEVNPILDIRSNVDWLPSTISVMVD